MDIQQVYDDSNIYDVTSDDPSEIMDFLDSDDVEADGPVHIQTDGDTHRIRVVADSSLTF
jgi:hypothetical protein